MKNSLKLFMVGIISMFALAFGVKAMDVTTADELKTCLAGTGTECTLKSQLTLSENLDLDLNNKTLNLEDSIVVGNGKKLTITGSGNVKGVGVDLFSVTAGGIIDLVSGSYTTNSAQGSIIWVKGDTVANNSKTNVTIGKNAVLTSNYPIGVGNNKGAAYGLTINVYGTLNASLVDSTVYNEGTIGIYINGSIQKTTDDVPVINVYDGAKVTAEHGKSNGDDDAPAVYAAGYAIWNISGGEFTGDEALSIKAGKFNITGGKFIANGVFVDPALAYSNGTEATGAALSVTANNSYAGNVEMNVSDVTVTSKNGYAFYEGISLKSDGTAAAGKIAFKDNGLKITSGVFTGNSEKGAIKTSIKEFITGGTYNTQISDSYLASKYTTVLKDGKYIVEENKVIETSNGDVTFESKDALDNNYILVVNEAAKETVEEVSFKVSEVYKNNKNVKDVDLIALYEINVTDGTTVIPMEDGKFTISIALDENMKKYDSYKVVYIDENGEIAETLDAEVVGDKLVYTTTHLSTYGIIGYNNVVSENPNTGDKLIVFVVIAIVSLFVSLISINKLRHNN